MGGDGSRWRKAYVIRQTSHAVPVAPAAPLRTRRRRFSLPRRRRTSGNSASDIRRRNRLAHDEHRGRAQRNSAATRAELRADRAAQRRSRRRLRKHAAAFRVIFFDPRPARSWNSRRGPRRWAALRAKRRPRRPRRAPKSPLTGRLRAARPDAHLAIDLPELRPATPRNIRRPRPRTSSASEDTGLSTSWARSSGPASTLRRPRHHHQAGHRPSSALTPARWPGRSAAGPLGPQTTRKSTSTRFSPGSSRIST